MQRVPAATLLPTHQQPGTTNANVPTAPATLRATAKGAPLPREAQAAIAALTPLGIHDTSHVPSMARTTHETTIRIVIALVRLSVMTPDLVIMTTVAPQPQLPITPRPQHLTPPHNRLTRSNLLLPLPTLPPAVTVPDPLHLTATGPGTPNTLATPLSRRETRNIPLIHTAGPHPGITPTATTLTLSHLTDGRDYLMMHLSTHSKRQHQRSPLFQYPYRYHFSTGYQQKLSSTPVPVISFPPP